MSHASLAARQANPATAAAILLILFNPLGIDLYLSALPMLQRQFHADASASIGAFVFSLGLGQLLFGPLADRLGRRPVALGGLLVYALASLLASRCDTLVSFLLARSLQGLAASASAVCAFAIIRDCFSGDAAAQRYSLLNGTLNIVPALAPAFGGLLAERYGWRACFYLLSASALAACALLAAAMPETRPQRPERSAGIRLAELLGHPALWRYGACSCTALGLILSYVTLAPGVLIARGGLPATTFGVLFGGNALLLMAASFVGLRLIGRFCQLAVLKLGLCLMLVAGALLLLLAGRPEAWHYLLPVGVLSVGFAFTLGPASSLAMGPFGHAAGRAAALLGCAQMLFASVLSGLLPQLPLPGEWALALAVLPLAGGCLLLLRSAPAPQARAATA
ncbi:Bcr/CflA family efflux MFS transporter [Chromobacterium paludis]|uniref:Bcr/CflA family efflux transporter n=1 Tax=Chromobacterium paludis TaxID=2605945 RepID=A0A5C1DKQ8_9NEIS|nr:Bcr/CflA family efflux MFS transporter [Chromobacterium paludis]QEL57234.1 multidrug effflux MFS transporter [Chromobacterium paludis]